MYSPQLVLLLDQQRSHLAPMLFIIFIKDINVQYCSKHMFADDIKMHR